MLTASLLGLLLAGADGGVNPDDGGTSLALLYAECPSDAPLAEPVDGGFFVTEARARRQVCLLAACESYATPKLQESQSSAPQLPTVLLLTGAGLSLLLAGVAIGYVVPHPK